MARRACKSGCQCAVTCLLENSTTQCFSSTNVVCWHARPCLPHRNVGNTAVHIKNGPRPSSPCSPARMPPIATARSCRQAAVCELRGSIAVPAVDMISFNILCTAKLLLDLHRSESLEAPEELSTSCQRHQPRWNGVRKQLRSCVDVGRNLQRPTVKWPTAPQDSTTVYKDLFSNATRRSAARSWFLSCSPRQV